MQNGLKQIPKMQNLLQNELDQITKTQNLPQNELEQIAKMRRIKKIQKSINGRVINCSFKIIAQFV